MNNLTTRKIVLGLLMTLVLTFGMQEIVDAIDDPNITSGLLDSTIHNVGAPVTIPPITINPDKTDLAETVSISKSSGVEFRGVFSGLSSVTLTEVDNDTTDTTNGTDFSYSNSRSIKTDLGGTSVTIPIRFTSKGKRTVTISGTDNNLAGTDKTSWSYKYTYYVKGGSTSTTTVSLEGLSNGYKTGIYSGSQLEVHNGDSNHYDVRYTTIPNTAQAKVETTLGVLPANATNLHNVNTSSAFDVYLVGNTGSVQVTAKVKGSERETVGVYIIGSPTLTVTSPTDTARGSKTTPGAINEPLTNAFTATVTDETSSDNNGVPGIVVKFQVKDSSTAGGNLVFDSARQDTPNVGILVTSERRRRFIAGTTANLQNDTAKTLYVRTNASGQATVDFRLGTGRKQDVTIDVLGSGVVGDNKTVSAYAGAAQNQLVDPRSKSSQVAGRSGEYELRVNVEDADETAVANEYVEFRTTDGTLDDPSRHPDETNLGSVRVKTDTQGIALIFFDPTADSASLRVTGHLLDLGDDNTLGGNDDTVIDDVVFNVKGGSTDRTQPPAQTPTNRLTITATGEGTTRTVTVNASDGRSVVATLSGSALAGSQGGGRTVTTGTPTTITLPSTPGSYTLIAASSGYISSGTETFTITAPGTLSLEEVGARAANGGQQIRITVRNSAGSLASGTVAVALSGAVSRTVSTTNGTGGAVITLPTTGGPHSVTLSATGYTTATHTFSVAGQQQPTTGQQPTPGGSTPAGTASSVRIRSEAFPSGTVNTQLAQPLAVRVLDANGTGVRNVRVTFQVTSGQGRLSQRGNGRATRVQTNASGDASTPYTPRSASSTVRATAAGVSQTVTFNITASGAATTTPTPTPGTGDTPTTISPVVHIAADSRPPMLWVDSGKIYGLVGKDVQEFVSGVDNAQNITVAGDKVYWTEKTGESGGTINAANLDGTGVAEITKILATPTGIAVDTTTRRIYVVNMGGRILSMNLDGSRIQTVLQNLSNPKDIAVSGGNAYWTQDTGAVRFVNLSGTKNVRNISNGADAAVSLVISGNKVYWTEQSGESGGTIKAANLNGTGVTRVASILAAPTGIAVDAARSKIYVTNTGGRILRMNLNGSYIQTVADGLGMPGDMVINNSIKAPAAPPTQTTPTASTSKYDLNGDGVVDAKDKALVFDAVMAGTYIAKYDVNGDKKLDILDYVRVDVAVDAGAASAPSRLGTKFSALEIDRLQEQIDLLIATGDRSPAAIKTLIYLQQLIVMARPEKTQLLANYPNPFNPETWIPYELATDTEVRITIYNAQGVVIRTLHLGQQSAGYYTDRERAAYWDGRNALGEQVASGIYFYQLETDEMSSMRKMVILK